GQPVPVRVHDFIDDALGKVIPYGIYDLARNTGWVNVGIDHDTPEFAVESISRWWRHMGKRAYPGAKELFITADGGGSNSSRARLWKT
ncbi:ISAzo13 family transposase, partial [Klebsiella pneumoniae]|nr:ISAzo13 family transposase [Klebsiella pneumoniae]